MHIHFRKVKFENEIELNYIAEMDSKIPLKYDSKYIWSEKAISLKVEQYKKQLTPDDFFEVVEQNNKIIGFHILKKVPYPPEVYAKCSS